MLLLKQASSDNIILLRLGLHSQGALTCSLQKGSFHCCLNLYSSILTCKADLVGQYLCSSPDSIVSPSLLLHMSLVFKRPQVHEATWQDECASHAVSFPVDSKNFEARLPPECYMIALEESGTDFSLALSIATAIISSGQKNISQLNPFSKSHCIRSDAS